MNVFESKIEKLKQGWVASMLIIKYRMLYCITCICIFVELCTLDGQVSYILTYVCM